MPIEDLYQEFVREVKNASEEEMLIDLICNKTSDIPKKAMDFLEKKDLQSPVTTTTLKYPFLDQGHGFKQNLRYDKKKSQQWSQHNSNDDNLNNIDLKETDEKWKYIAKFVKVYTFVMQQNFDVELNYKKMGSLLFKNLDWINDPINGCKNSIQNELHQLFTISGNNLSLPDISYLYAMKDIRAINNNDFPKSGSGLPPPLINLEESFISCFTDLANNISNTQEIFLGHAHKSQINMNFFPCRHLEEFPKCLDYCISHKNLINELDNTEFLTVMRYAQPQQKISLDPIFLHEKKLIAKLFELEQIQKVNKTVAPMAMPIFCHSTGEGFIGDDIKGISGKVCNDFFPTPTDNGMCLTRNLDLKEMMYINKDYDVLLEPDSRPDNRKIEGESLWSETTLVFYTDADYVYNSVIRSAFNFLSQSYPSEPDIDLGEIQFQLNQPKELAKMFQECSAI